MNSFFSPDNKIYQFINALFYSTLLNILWFICCIPIFTIGASTTALYNVTLKLVRGEEGNVSHQFFSAFRSNFKKATGIWMILLLLGIILGIDGYVLYRIHFDNMFWTICTAILIAVNIIYVIILLNIFPLFARFDNSIRNTFINAFLVGIRYLFCSIVMAAIHFVIYYITIMFFTPLIIFGQGLCALMCSWLISPILGIIEEDSN